MTQTKDFVGSVSWNCSYEPAYQAVSTHHITVDGTGKEAILTTTFSTSQISVFLEVMR